MIPEGWKIFPLRELAKIERGKFSVRPRNDPRYYGGDMPFVQTGDIARSKIFLKHFSQTLNDDGLAVSKVFPAKTILMTIAANIGDTAITTFEVACPDSLVAIMVFPQAADEYWLKNVFETKKKVLDSQATQNAQKNINLEVLKPLKVLTPPLPEQKKIAQILATWDQAIATTEQLLANSQQQKKALMQQLLTGKKRLLGETKSLVVRDAYAKSKLGAFPSDWSVELIGGHLWFQEGPGVRKHQFKDQGVKLFNGTNIQANEIRLSNTSTYISSSEANGVYSHFLANEGDLVIACSGVSIDKFDEKIGFIEKKHLPLCMNTSTMRFKALDHGGVDIVYFQYFMQSPIFKNQIRRQATGSAQLNFGPSHVSKCFVVMPSLAEQKLIGTAISERDKEISNLTGSIDLLKREKKALMQQLLTGKRRVKVDQEVA